MRIQRGIDALQVGGQRRFQLSARGRIPDARHRWLVEHHKAQRLAQVGAGDHAGLDGFVHYQLVFNRCGRHIFALAGLEQVLDAPGDMQVALRIDLSLVARAQPAVVGKGGAALHWVFVVAHHQGRAAHVDFAGFRVNAVFHPFIGGPHRALLIDARYCQV